MADADISLGLSAQELYGELQNVTAKFVKFAQDAQTSGEKAGKGFGDGVKSGFGSLGTNLVQAAGALGIGHEIKDVIEYGAKVQDLANRYGVSTDAIQRYGRAAELTGSSQEAITKAIGRFEVAESKALGGNDAMKASLAVLGLSMDDIVKLSFDEKMALVGRSSLNAADGVKIFGKGFLEIAPALKGVGDGTIQLGDAISAIDIAKLKEAEDAFKKMHQAVTIFLGGLVGGFLANFQASISELVGKILAAIEEIKGAAAAAERLLHGDTGGAKKALTTGHENALEQIKQANIDAEAYRHPEEKGKARDLGLGGRDSEGGETDDEGRSLGKKEKRELERDSDKLRKIERERELDALPYEQRQAELHKQADFLNRGAASAPDEESRVQAKLAYYEIVKQIEKEEDAHAQEMLKAERERNSEAKKEKREAISEWKKQEKLNQRTPEEIRADNLKEAQARDLADRRRHGSYTGPGGGDHSGLVTTGVEGSGPLQTASLIGDRSTEDFHKDFGKHVDLGPKHLDINERLSAQKKLNESAKDLGSTKADPGKTLDGAAGKLDKVADKLDKALHI